jgi:hypothetical protein
MARVLGTLTALLTLVGPLELVLAESKSPRQIAQEAFPSVVLLLMQDRNGQPTALGSGFVLRDGLVVTNLHVISGAASGYCKLVGKSMKYEIAGNGSCGHITRLGNFSRNRSEGSPVGNWRQRPNRCG